MNKLIFDIGTNSIKYFFFAFQNDAWKIVEKGKIENRMGNKIKNACDSIAEEDVYNCANIINQIIAKLESKVPVQCAAFGTEIFRMVNNSKEIIREIEKQTSIHVHVLSKEQELEVYWNGLIKDFNHEGIVAAIDIGGGSVQFMYGDKYGLKGCHYLKTGALFLRNQFIKSEPPTIEEYRLIEEEIREQIKNINICFPPNTPFIHGSTSVIDFYTEAKLPLMAYDGSPNHPYKMDLKDTRAFYNMLRTLPREDRVKYFPSEPGFTEGASIGMANVLLIAEKTGLMYEIPSNNSIIHGFL